MDETLLWCLLVTGILPFICAGITKSKKSFDNSDPRAWQAQQEGYRGRAYAAQQNSWEAFIWLTVAILVATVSENNNLEYVKNCALAFVFFRLLFILLYLADLSSARTVAWIGSKACVFLIFFSAF